MWLVRTDDVISAIEEGDSGMSTARGKLAHTNLSGGSSAHAGGELWFEDGNSVLLNGGSSRYAPKNNDEMLDIVQAFRKSGYRVCYSGWSEEENCPKRDFRNPNWLEKLP